MDPIEHIKHREQVEHIENRGIIEHIEHIYPIDT